jgi:hypothetical protein
MLSADARNYRATKSSCVAHNHEIVHQTKFKLDDKESREIADAMRCQQLMKLLIEDRIMRATDFADIALIVAGTFTRKPQWDAMAQPYAHELQHPALVMTCPNCVITMRIRTIELRDGRERITLDCEECGREAFLDSPLSRR